MMRSLRPNNGPREAALYFRASTNTSPDVRLVRVNCFHGFADFDARFFLCADTAASSASGLRFAGFGRFAEDIISGPASEGESTPCTSESPRAHIARPTSSAFHSSPNSFALADRRLASSQQQSRVYFRSSPAPSIASSAMNGMSSGTKGLKTAVAVAGPIPRSWHKASTEPRIFFSTLLFSCKHAKASLVAWVTSSSEFDSSSFISGRKVPLVIFQFITICSSSLVRNPLSLYALGSSFRNQTSHLTSSCSFFRLFPMA